MRGINYASLQRLGGRWFRPPSSLHMQLKLIRQEFTDKSTIGRLEIDGEFFCWTLEDKVRPEKIAGQTAIPAGKYEIDINWSERFKRYLPIILNVPHFTGIRIHSGNTAADTAGCILVGRTKETDFIGESVLAMNDLFPKLLKAIREDQKITIDIIEKTQ